MEGMSKLILITLFDYKAIIKVHKTDQFIEQAHVVTWVFDIHFKQ